VSGARGPAPSGARLLGDDYQHLLTWLYAAQLLRKDPRVLKVELEKHGVGNVDDLVVHRHDRCEYHQVKFATKPAGEPLTGEWFTDTNRSQHSPLERFHDSWKRLSQDGRDPRMVLHTNRQPAAGDPLLACLSGETDLLVPQLTRAAAGSRAGRFRAAWAEHLEIDEAELLTMLADLEIRAARASTAELREHCRLAMDAVGLLSTDAAIDEGMVAVRGWIEHGVREVSADTVSAFASERGLHATEPRAWLLIQGIHADPVPELATVALDWVSEYEGSQATTRRRTKSPAIYEERFGPELEDAERRIRALDYRQVRVTGAFRLTTAIRTGATFSDTAGYSLACTGRTADGRRVEFTTEGVGTTVAIEVVATEIAEGDAAIAVGLSVASDLSDDVMRFLKADGPAVSRFYNLRVADPGRGALADADAMRGWTSIVTDHLRAIEVPRPEMLHLFVAAPMPAALFLGHQWNRMPPTQLWEELAPGQYAPAYLLA
jgi:hypothetical protein